MPFLEEKHVQLLRSSGLVGKVRLSTDMSQDDYNYGRSVITSKDLLVDSTDSGRLEESRVQLDELLVEDKLTGVPLLVFANKQDLGMALKADDISNDMKLTELTDRQWQIQPCSAKTEEGIAVHNNPLTSRLGWKDKPPCWSFSTELNFNHEV
ncbi:uncharacterized protein LOC135344181 [Halichondria panicea]|uniref:uncharacterized protein LOC135344181 n=1 Tax=Halichondria panicea TaxID=6063 RepID=UPI00312B7FAF